MKVGRSSIIVNVLAPYTRVGHCDNARWISVPVLASLMGNKLTQGLKRIIASCTDKRSFSCHFLLLLSLMRNHCQRTSPATRWRYSNRSVCHTNTIHVQKAKILSELTVQKPLTPRSRKKAPSSNASRPSTSSCHCRAPPHDDSRILPPSSKIVFHLKRSLPEERKQNILVRCRIPTIEGDEDAILWQKEPDPKIPKPSVCRPCVFSLCHLPVS